MAQGAHLAARARVPTPQHPRHPHRIPGAAGGTGGAARSRRGECKLTDRNDICLFNETVRRLPKAYN